MTRLNSLTKKIQLTLSLHVISNINARKNHLNNPFIKCKQQSTIYSQPKFSKLNNT